MKNKLIKIVLMVIIIPEATYWIVYASNIIYQKVWKEPEKYTFSELIVVCKKDKQKSIAK